MKLELKNIKHTAWASEETHCYQASLYVNGKPVAIVSNDGRGGTDRDYPHPKIEAHTYRFVMTEVHAYFKSLPNTPSEWNEDGMEQRLEFWCADQVNDWLSARELKSKLRKAFLFQFADRVGVFAHKTRPSRAAGVAVVLNDLPFDEALSIWKETANV
jgi:hypothetical protein